VCSKATGQCMQPVVPPPPPTSGPLTTYFKVYDEAHYDHAPCATRDCNVYLAAGYTAAAAPEGYCVFPPGNTTEPTVDVKLFYGDEDNMGAPVAPPATHFTTSSASRLPGTRRGGGRSRCGTARAGTSTGRSQAHKAAQAPSRTATRSCLPSALWRRPHSNFSSPRRAARAPLAQAQGGRPAPHWPDSWRARIFIGGGARVVLVHLPLPPPL
jgi:hypothetical protein